MTKLRRMDTTWIFMCLKTHDLSQAAARSEPSDVQQKKEAQLGIKSIDIEEEASHD